MRFSVLTLVTVHCDARSARIRSEQAAQSTAKALPAWTKKTGGRRDALNRPKDYFGEFTWSQADGVTNSTIAIQTAIDECSRSGGGIVTFEKGEYVTGATIPGNNVDCWSVHGVILLGSQDESDYPQLLRLASPESR